MIQQKATKYYGLLCTSFLLKHLDRINDKSFEGLVSALDKCSQEARPAGVLEDENYYCRCDVCPLLKKCVDTYGELCRIIADRRLLLMPGDGIEAQKETGDKRKIRRKQRYGDIRAYLEGVL